MKSGKQIGNDYVAILNAFLQSGDKLPISANAGTLNLTELHRLTGIPRSSFYQNESLKTILEKAHDEQGIPRWGQVSAASSDEVDREAADVKGPDRELKATRLLERKVHQLEQQNACLMGENFELRRQVKEFKLEVARFDFMAETGRRVAVP